MSGHKRSQGQDAHGRMRSSPVPANVAVRKLQRDPRHRRQSLEALKKKTTTKRLLTHEQNMNITPPPSSSLFVLRFYFLEIFFSTLLNPTIEIFPLPKLPRGLGSFRLNFQVFFIKIFIYTRIYIDTQICCFTTYAKPTYVVAIKHVPLYRV